MLVRHGHRTDDGDTPSPGLGLAPLSALGERQAWAFAESIEQRPDLIVTSTFVRAVQTAEPLRRRFPDSPGEIWPVEEFTFLPPALFEGTTFRDREGANAAYWLRADPDWHPGPGGESFREFIARVDGIIARIERRSEAFIVVVSHGYTLQAWLWRLARPGREIDGASFAEWNKFREKHHFAPTGWVEICGGVVGAIQPPPLVGAGGGIAA